eukprot:4602851-Amphidinium_carterae.1
MFILHGMSYNAAVNAHTKTLKYRGAVHEVYGWGNFWGSMGDAVRMFILDVHECCSYHKVHIWGNLWAEGGRSYKDAVKGSCS